MRADLNGRNDDRNSVGRHNRDCGDLVGLSDMPRWLEFLPWLVKMQAGRVKGSVCERFEAVEMPDMLFGHYGER